MPTAPSLHLLVNLAGDYSGTVIFNTTRGKQTAAFKVASSAAWTITIKSWQMARSWDAATQLTGTGDDVMLIEKPVWGLVTAKITNAGDAYFGVWAYGATSEDLLVNLAGTYSGLVQLPSGTVILVVRSNGSWTVTIQT